MIHEREIIQSIEGLSSGPFKGIVYRHMFGDLDPFLENRRGARWNPSEIAAIYTSLEKETALAESDYQISMQPLRPKAKRVLYKLEVSLNSVLFADTIDIIKKIGFEINLMGDLEISDCQRIGGAVEWLNHDGLLIPSARLAGKNLVIYTNKTTLDFSMEKIGEELIPDSSLGV